MKLINEVAHRPYPLPSKNWIMRQSWSNLLFLHWPISPTILKPFIPSPLQIDIFQQHAWISIVGFCMEGIHPRGLTKVSLTPKFSEINVRTYVLHNGKPGVYFLSLDVDDWASFNIAKRWYHLPYHAAKISIQKEGKRFHFESLRKRKNTKAIIFKGTYEPISEIYLPQKGTLDYWLTERYCLYSTDNTVDIFCGEIHHCPWPLQKVKAEIWENTLFSPMSLNLSNIAPISHYSEGVDTLFWNARRM